MELPKCEDLFETVNKDYSKGLLATNVPESGLIPMYLAALLVLDDMQMSFN